MARFLHTHAFVHPSADLKLMGWLSDGRLALVVGFNGFIGKVAQIHVAYAEGWNYTPRKMLREVFRYAFNTAGREMLIGVVNSKNVRAMRMDIHLGFTERFRLPGMHDDGGDLVVLGMDKSECRYLTDADDIQVEHAAGHA
jgi:L-amino acid N-acyltransferase YncA